MSGRLIYLVSLILALGLVLANAAEAQLDPNLVGWWKLDDAVGTTFVDSSSYGHNGTIESPDETRVTWTEDGYEGGALQFLSYNYPPYCDADLAPDLLNMQEATASFWMNMPTVYQAWGIILDLIGSSDNSIEAHDGAGIYVTVYGANLWFRCPTGGLNDNQWHHVVATYSASSNKLAVYLDGEEDVSVAYSYGGESISTVRIGGPRQYTAVWRRLLGRLDEVSVFNRALSATDVTNLYWYGPEWSLFATDPDPADRATAPTVEVTLSWTAGTTAASHRVYVGENLSDVQNGTGGTDQGTTTEASFSNYPWEIGKTYYWRIDEVESDGMTVRPGVVWSFTVSPVTAFNPAPSDGAALVDPNVELSWSAGLGAVSHDVYFGTDPNPPLIEAGWSATTYDPPGDLNYSTTYYWRIDENDGTTTHEGDIWSFKTRPDAQITDPNLVGLYNFNEDEQTIAVDWSGNDNHGQIFGDPLYVAGYDGSAIQFDGNDDAVEVPTTTSNNFTLMAWIKTDTPGPGGTAGRDGSGLIWSDYSGGGDHFMLSVLGTKLAFQTGPDTTMTAISSRDIVTNRWVHVAATRTEDGEIDVFIDGTSEITATHTTQAIGRNRVAIGANLFDSRYFTGLIDEVRIYDRVLTQEEIQQAMRSNPRLAWQPYPANGSTPDIKQATYLSWMAGETADTHDVYFGTDPAAVANAGISDAAGIYKGRQSETAYTLSEALQWAQTYYWRIDEVNAPPDSTIHAGNIWSFTIAEFFVVDDFEDYNDSTEGAVWATWTGWEQADNGVYVGHEDPPYCEQTIVNSGTQSMPVYYDNSAGLSEATKTLISVRDWTEEGVKALSLWFRGYAASVGSFTEGPAGTYTMTATGADIFGRADQFHFAYKMLSGVGAIEAQVLSIDNTDPWALVGLMIRETLEPGSKSAAVFITAENGCRSRARLQTGIDALSDTEVATDEQMAVGAPYWVRLERSLSGDFTFYYSSDGSDWQLMAWSPQLVPMNTTVHVGLAVSAHNADATCEAQFSNVTIEGNVSGDWMSQDIGIQSNDAEPLYVVVANNTGTPAVVYHDDPNAAQLDDWMEWNIELKDFEDQGVNLADVNSIIVGLGNRANPQAGGAGIMYFDDIRLYQPRCVPDKLELSAADLNSDCVVDLRDLEILVGDWLLADDLVATTAPSDDGLVAHWMLDGSADDSSGNGHNGTLNGSPQWISGGHVGGALQLDGVDDYVDCANDVGFDITDTITLAAWVNTNDVGNGEHNPYVSKGDTAYAIKGHINGSIEFFIYEDDWYYAQSTMDLSTFNGEWHHVAGTYDGNEIKLYIDGMLAATSEHVGSIAINTFPVYIGSNSEAEGRFYDGLIDDVRIYSRALSKEEVGYLGDLTPGDGQVYTALSSSAELYGAEPQGSKSIDFKDFAVLVDQWLAEQVWP